MTALDPLHKHDLAERRQRLMSQIGEDSIVIISAAAEAKRSGDTYYRYRQDSNFYYLSGFLEPDAIMVLVPGRASAEYVMFCRDRDPLREQWDGFRMGIERAAEYLGTDDAFPISDIDEILPGLIEGREKVYSFVGDDLEFDQRLMGWVNKIRARVRSGAKPPNEFVALGTLIYEMRLHKSPHEIEIMRAASKVAMRAQNRMMTNVKPGMMEYELMAELQHELTRNHCQEPYTSIIAGGRNACILHYIENNQLLHNGEMILVDAGAEFQCYAADITRTYPVSGTFSSAQRELYEIVLAANKACIEMIKPGLAFEALQETAIKILSQGLVDLKLLKGSVEEVIESKSYRRFYMHNIGHWLGLDTHDVGEYKIDGQSRALAQNMVLTIEPGLYIDDGVDLPEAFRNTGIRIEDNILVTAKGHDNLTADCPKDIASIEATIRG